MAWNAGEEMKKRREAAKAQGKGNWNAGEEMKKRREAAAAKKEAARKEAERNERDTNYRNNTKPTGFTQMEKPAGTQKPKEKKQYNGAAMKSQRPNASQTKEMREDKNSRDTAARAAKRSVTEANIAKNQKKIEWRNSQMNNSVGYQNMMKRKTEAARRKAMEKVFGR